jgi:hypothetical protein
VIPDEVYQFCRPQSTVIDAIGGRVGKAEVSQRQAGQLGLFGGYTPDQYLYSQDFRRQLKLRAMAYGIPTQIVRESTLTVEADGGERKERGLTPVTDRMWNLSSTLYYKCGGKPWRLADARDGVCYIGLAYRRTNTSSSNRTACCAALMFLSDGDGIVFRGEHGPWWSPERKQFHLPREAAYELLSGALETYREFDGRPLTEVFLHARSGIDWEEYEGFRDACPKQMNVVGVRIRRETRGVRMYREGQLPVCRGTLWRVGDRRAFLWASGFKPRLGTYDGHEVPAPMKIDIQRGHADIDVVAQDILALTKLNYNACKLGDSEPVTILFSDAVGEILVTDAPIQGARPNFKFYI